MSEPGCVFVVGCPRSGTYLLSLMLGAECGVAIPVETHFIPLFERFLPVFGDLSVRRNRERLVQCIYDFLEIWTPRSERDRDPEVIRRYSLLATRSVASSIVERSSDYASLVAEMFGCYAALQGCVTYGDKSAFFRHSSLERLASLNPNSKFVHVIRDGRDVSVSWLSIWTGPVNLTQSAVNWMAHVERKRSWGKQNPERYLEVRYEELISDPKETLDNICAFAGISRDEDAVPFHDSELASVLSRGGPHEKVSQPLEPGNRGKWRSRMTPIEQSRFTALAHATLLSCGYDCGCVDRGLHSWTILPFVTAYERVRGIISLHELQLQLKNLLPLALFACHIVSFPLARVLNRRYPAFRPPD